MTFKFSVRVYFEDTDAGGIVYYGNYLKFMERARSEYFLQKSIGMKSLMNDHELVFVVSRTELNYLRSAKLEDVLEISVELAELKRVSAVFKQVVTCNGEVLCEGKTKVACVNTQTMKPSAMPPVVYQQLNQLLA
ncbi:tol-pal system-associated acyl-CoA thioesterase [Limnobacter parvus]|uniref:Tol-pal system-associated acyl-CoA thioesterase n=1 Tax=Limnobacter parvus TaxID=2939690 RepID=A0ABT1XGB2_9BURK|nr:tol-pal system-associated acyl-CoA thioesterase [Limnobacter parvus]MCR2746323.1 tol-pal system-associated acyl-CoA thioesterase [Limnobacter parvus]